MRLLRAEASMRPLSPFYDGSADDTEHGGSGVEATQPKRQVPKIIPRSSEYLIQVEWLESEYRNGPSDLWWTMPQEKSTHILNEWKNAVVPLDRGIVYTWTGSYQPDGSCYRDEKTTRSYEINFWSMCQRNISGPYHHARRVRVVNIVR